MNDETASILRRAMTNVSVDDRVADAIESALGNANEAEAVTINTQFRSFLPAARDSERDELEAQAKEEKAKQEAEAQRQRDLDAAMIGTVKLVEAMRQRLGRRDWANHDGGTINKIFALLKAMNGLSDPDNG